VHEAVVGRILEADRESVWRALTEPDALAAWFWPWQPSVEFSATPGAAYAFEAEHPQAGRLAVDGRVMAVEPPARLAMTWRWTDEPMPPTEVEIRLADVDGATEVVVRHRRVELEATAADYERAWTDLLERLAGYVERANATAEA
jgi:uncharacterized protein YndB with AHSA1/START domain